MDHTWAVLAGVLFAPFVQEDAAVFGAAGVSLMGVAPAEVVFGVALLGLTLSDTWKYWLGRYAATHAWARKFAEKPKALAARERVLKHLPMAMLTARFVPGTRVPLYLAAGLFGAPFLAFFALVVATGALYLAIAFALVRALGAVAGEQAATWLPLGIAGIALTYFAALGVRALLKKRSPAAATVSDPPPAT